MVSSQAAVVREPAEGSLDDPAAGLDHESRPSLPRTRRRRSPLSCSNTRVADLYGRCVVFVGKGTPPVYSGYWTGVDEALPKRTANHRLLLLGLAYPTFYSGLPVYLRELLTEASEKARASAKGVWAVDKSLHGATVTE